MSAEDFLPGPRDLASLAESSRSCRGCPLYEPATQTVFGRGSPDARLMLVGEQPGDSEDRQGLPFVGPAGRLLEECLGRADLSWQNLYVTNAVKHFKFEVRGAKRLHKKPSARDVRDCRPWLMAEIEAVRPKLVLCLGATAAQTLLGSEFRVTKERGRPRPGPAGVQVMATVHPSALLRASDRATRQAETDRFVADLAAAGRLVASA